VLIVDEIEFSNVKPNGEGNGLAGSASNGGTSNGTAGNASNGSTNMTTSGAPAADVPEKAAPPAVNSQPPANFTGFESFGGPNPFYPPEG